MIIGRRLCLREVPRAKGRVVKPTPQVPILPTPKSSRGRKDGGELFASLFKLNRVFMHLYQDLSMIRRAQEV